MQLKFDLPPFQEVKAELARRGVSQRAIALQLGVHPTLVHLVMKGRAVSSRVTAAIARQIGLDVEHEDESHQR